MSDWRQDVTHELPDNLWERLAVDCPDAVVFSDREGKIRFWNPSATRIFGFAD